MEIIWILVLVQAYVFGKFCAFIAKEKNRDSASWFYLGFFFSLLALVAIAAVPAKQDIGGVANAVSAPSVVDAEKLRDEERQERRTGYMVLLVGTVVAIVLIGSFA